jgi:hypothetical protein
VKRFVATAVFLATVVLIPIPLRAAWPTRPPALPAPTGAVVKVATEPQLQAAVAALRSHETILIAPGTYRLSHTLAVQGPLDGVTIRGATGNRDDVVLVGYGRDNADYGPVPHGIWVNGDVRRLTIANLTIGETYFHAICFNPGPTAPRVYNVHLVNAGQQLLKTNPNPDGSGIDNGVVEYSLFDYAPESRDWYANAIQVLAGRDWVIRDNFIRNIHAPRGELAGPAVLAWFGASGTVVERNTFVNCQREISFGLVVRSPHDHEGGVIRNNVIYRDQAVANGDVAIGVFDSPGSVVANNTIVMSGSYPNAIECRFAGTSAVRVVNNLSNRRVTLRDGATATLTSNVDTASPEWFVDPRAIERHVRPEVSEVVGRGTALPNVVDDWEGHARPIGRAPDVGAGQAVRVPVSKLPRQLIGFHQ